MYEYDVISVGDTKLDIFLSIHDSNNKCRVDAASRDLCVKHGEKIEVEHSEFCLGGNATNVAVGLSRLGIKTALFSEIGNDEFSLKIVNMLAHENMTRSFVKHSRHAPSSFSIAINFKGDRTLFSEHIHREHEFNYEGVHAKMLFLTSLGQEWETPYKKALEYAVTHNVQIAFNPGSIQLREGKDVVKKLLAKTYVLFLNKEEGEQLLFGSETKNDDEKYKEELLIKLQKLGPRIVVMTDGAHGSYTIDEHGKTHIFGLVPAKVIEKTGAGDAYTSGFLAALLHGQSITEAMRWGALNAASVIEKVGSEAGLLTKEKMRERIDSTEYSLGYRNPLYILAFDHRNTFAEHLFKTEVEHMTLEQRALIRDFKQIIYEAFRDAVAMGIPKEDAAILVDEEYGYAILRNANKNNFSTILTTEKTGQKAFTFEYGEDFKAHIELYHPTFAKALIKYNPDDDVKQKKAQQKGLRELSNFCHQRGYKFLLEVVVPPSQRQLTKVKNDIDMYDSILRPKLVAKLIKELQDARIEPDIWKLEGLETEKDYKKIMRQIRSDNRNNVSMVVLGRGANKEKVTRWIQEGAKVPGVVGFAVGRTIFWDAIVSHYNGKITLHEAIDIISKNFFYFYKVFANLPEKDFDTLGLQKVFISA